MLKSLKGAIAGQKEDVFSQDSPPTVISKAFLAHFKPQDCFSVPSLTTKGHQNFELLKTEKNST